MDLDRTTILLRKTNDYPRHCTHIRSSLLHHATQCLARMELRHITRQHRCPIMVILHRQLSQWTSTIPLQIHGRSIAARTTIHKLHRTQSYMSAVEMTELPAAALPEDLRPLTVERVLHNLRNRDIDKVQPVQLTTTQQLRNSFRLEPTTNHALLQVQATTKAPRLEPLHHRIPFNHRTHHLL